MQLITKPNGDNDVDIDGSSIQMIDPVKKDRTTFQQVYEKWLVPPDKLGDVLALAGDTVDNVPGKHIHNSKMQCYTYCMNRTFFSNDIF